MKRVVLSVVMVGLVVCMGAGVKAQSRADDLPDGEGKDLVVRMCSDCHGLSEVTSRRETEKEWAGIISDMVALGVEGTDEEQKIAAAYLGKCFGREVTAPAAADPTAAPASTAEPAVALATTAYAARCASCHGAKMTGGDGPANLAYIRYHTDVEVADVIRNGRPKMPAMQVPQDELQQILADIRVLAGTNPAMATGGFTGRRGGPGGAARAGGPGAAPSASRGGGRGGRGGAGEPRVSSAPMTVTLADGRTLSGKVMAQSDFDATLLANNKFHLLAKDGKIFREKPIAPKSDWLDYDGGPSGNRYSTLKEINTANVQQLAPAWMFPMPNSSRLEVTPVVVDGIMYVTGWNEVYALDATTGRQLWTYNEPHTEGILSEGGAGANRGATISGDRVFAITDRAHLLAFNRFTGEKLWDVEMGSVKESYSATAAPLIAGDLVVSGVAGGEEGARGFVDAYRMSTGDRVWRFYTIPKRGEKGSETWIGQALEHGCGATWLTGSYDPTLDLQYWTVGNPCPDYTGDERMGDNLYTNSVVALASKTGEMKWYYQFTPHDTHDWDANSPLVLVDEPWQGRPRKLIFHADRNGFFYVFDRTNGEVLFHEAIVGKQNWNLGFTKEGRPLIDPASVSTREGVAVCPASGGGTNWPAVSYNPIARLFYFRISDSCGIYTSHHDPLGVSGNRWFGRGTPGDSQKAQQALAALQVNYPNATFIRAIDPFTGKKMWDYPAPPGRSGVLSTAGGLVFIGGGGGLMALDAKAGKAVWHVNLGQNTQSTPMTYMVGGTQYIALPGVGVVVAYALH